MIDEPGAVIGFWVLSAATVGSALMVAVQRNLLHAVLFLVLSFVGLAGLYVVLSADFVATAQILIYAGGISVLIVFAVMLTPRNSRRNDDSIFWGPALISVALLLVTVLFVVLQTNWPTEDRTVDTTAAAIGSALVDTYVLPFEIASVLLTAAMVGALVLIRERGKEEL